MGYLACLPMLLVPDPASGLQDSTVQRRGSTGLAESPDGSILAADTHSLTKLEPSGHPMWKVGIGTSTSLIPPALAVDAQGTSYVATSDGDLRVISSAGTHIAQIVMGKPQLGSRPAIALGRADRLVVLGADGILHVYGG